MIWAARGMAGTRLDRSTASAHSTSFARPAALAVALIALASVLVAAWRQDATYDEEFHLEYSRQLLAWQPPSRDSVFNSKTPALLPNALLETGVRALGADDPRLLRFAGRLPSIGVYLLLLAAVFRVTRSRAPASVAWFAVLLCALDPNLLAHGGLMTVDVPFALACFLALAAMVRFARSPGWRETTWLGATLGVALAVKFTSLFLLPAFGALLVWTPESRPLTRADVVDRAGRLASAAALASMVVSASYLFHAFAQPLAAIDFRTASSQAIAGAVGWLRLPLPAEFLTGIDRVMHLERTQSFNVVILDRWYDNGTWYYFFVLALLKTPIALLTACAVALWVGLRTNAWRHAGLALPVVQSIAFFAYFSFLFRGQIGYRYVLMILPWVYVTAASGLGSLLERRKGVWVVAAVTVVALVESMPVFGHPLAFTNALVPKDRAYLYVADSNLYWNEYHDQLESIAATVGVPPAAINPPHLLPDPVVFDANALSGILWDFGRHRWVRRNIEPRRHIRHVLFMFDVSGEDFSRFLDANRRVLPLAERVQCAVPDAPTFERPMVSRSQTRICADAFETTDVVFAAAAGSAVVGVEGADGRCRGDRLRGGQEIWFRLEPGHHVLCVVNATQFDGEWRIARGRATPFNTDTASLGEARP
jgi:hypothetical protein